MTVPYAPSYMQGSTSNPLPPGALSNKRGSNTGADALPLYLRYANARASSKAGTIRVIANRVARSGNPINAQTIWDSSWVGNPTTSSTGIDDFMHAQNVVYYNGRLYIYYSAGVTNGEACKSAAVSGRSIGSWRTENAIIVNSSPQAAGGFVILNGWAYAVTVANSAGPNAIYSAPINIDGTIGTWGPAGVGGVTVTCANGSGLSMAGYADGVNGFLIVVGGNNGASTMVQYCRINPDGTISGFSSGTALPAAREYIRLVYEHSSKFLFAIGGDDNVNAQPTVYWSTITETTGSNAAWATGGVGLPAGRTLGGLAVIMNPATGAIVEFYYLGGDSGVNVAAQSTVYYVTRANIGAAWTTSTNPMPAAERGTAAFLIPDLAYDAVNGATPTLGYVGGASVGSGIPKVASVPASGGLNQPFVSGVGTALAAAQLGTGASVTNNQDGTEDFTINYGAFGGAPYYGGGLFDGDTIQITTFFTDNAAGDASPGTTASLRIGQPPTISGITSSDLGYARTISWTYVPGAGGGAQKSWRISFWSGGLGGTMVGDSGIQIGTQNSYQPRLQPLNAWDTFQITVVSTDIPVLGSSSSAVSSSTPSFTGATAPGVPTVVTVVADAINSLYTIAWQNPVASPQANFNRVYWRPSGTSTWLLLKDNIAASGANIQQSIQTMEVPIGIPLDFAVSAYTSALANESAKSGTVSVTLRPDYRFETGGYQAVLSIAGTLTKCRLWLSSPPHFRRLYDAIYEATFADVAPRARFGVQNYRELTLSASFALTGSNDSVDTLQAVLDAALLGSILLYRDVTGNLLYVTPAAERLRDLDLYVDERLTLQEVAYTYTP